jgi:hypothetical protein
MNFAIVLGLLLVSGWLGSDPAGKQIYPAAQARAGLAGFITKAPNRLPGQQGHYRAVFDSNPKERITRTIH